MTMTWTAENPSTIMVSMAYDLYNKTKAGDLPQAGGGAWGIDQTVWSALIALTRTNCTALRIPQIDGSLKGLCIWGSVVAAKFLVHRFAYASVRVVRINSAGDHYFAVIKNQKNVGICDITCNQFGGPDWIAGWVKDVKGPAQKVIIGTENLYKGYQVGAGSSTFVV
jgi:hypothetical protein